MLINNAYDNTLVYGNNTVNLSPSLRAATQLERLHDGFPALLRRVQAFDLTTIRAIITIAATDKQEARVFLAGMANAPLATIRNVTTAPAFVLLTALMTPVLPKGEATKAPSSNPVAWSELYSDLFQIATGWLGWPPAYAWAATLIEITSAFDGLIAKLKATNGGDTDETQSNSVASQDQRQANIDAGLDPDFNREGLEALKKRLQG